MILLSCSALAATGSSPEFRLDLRGLGPWQRHVARASEPLAYSSAWTTNAATGAKAVVKVMPVLKTKPKYLVIDLSGGTNATQYGISYLDEVPGGSWSDEYKTSKLVLRHIPAGSFIMGSRASDFPGHVNQNLHMVTITRDFYMGVFEVTQRQWELVMGNRPSAFSNETCYATRPVEKVSYADVRGGIEGLKWPISQCVDEEAFLGRMRSKVSVSGFDLPTEAQWEYACRAGVYSALNNGLNLSSNPYAIEMKITDHCLWQCGYLEFKEVNEGLTQLDFVKTYGNAVTNFGTAAVGTYPANKLGLYGFHGNVSEMCLNRYQISPTESIDPVGSLDLNAGGMWKGGSWIHSAYGCTSGSREAFGTNFTVKNYFVGFRLCLQGGDVPDLAAATTLVNESGTGSQSWTPTRAGTYYLTHSTMNGTTNAQLMSAWFEVPGCELTLEPQGELTNGVSVAIGGAGEGWNVYYTTDGSAPTQESAQYTGAFSLPASGTVRAIAYNAQGVASEEAMETFTLHDALGVVGAVARPRYPWNGMVDVDCELKGDSDRKYVVELVAKDLDGGTNLAVKTVGARVPACPHVNVEANGMCWECGHAGRVTLPAGCHRLTWNAGEDIATDGEFPRMAVTVKATAPSALDDYARQFEISIDGYAGSETLTNVPVLVRLSKAIDGFDYGDFANPTNGADLAFFDANERRLPYEIDEWHTNGESLVWVKLPEMRKGTRFTCAYGNVDAVGGAVGGDAFGPNASTAGGAGGGDAFGSNASTSGGAGGGDAFGPNASTSRDRMKHEVWREYAGVWHMNEDSGTAFDSTEHGLDALPNCGTNKLADISQMVAYENGACGRARVNATEHVFSGNGLMVPSYDALGLSDTFVASGWFRADGKTIVRHIMPKLLSRKLTYDALSGWDCLVGNVDYSAFWARGVGTNCLEVASVSMVDNWVHLSIAYDGNAVKGFVNGSLVGEAKISAPTDNGRELMIGNDASNGAIGYSFAGQYDEIRLRGGSLSADRIKADYDIVAKRDFCTYGAVKKGAGK